VGRNGKSRHSSLEATSLTIFQWQQNDIGWHQDNVHQALVSYGHLLIPSDSKEPNACTAKNPVRIFFPLCGKTIDMAHLALRNDQVSHVCGIDGVKKSLEEFCSENPALEIKEDTKATSKMSHFVGNKITLLQGDFFTLTEQDTEGKFEAIFDRGSLVAIDPSLRQDYVQIMSKVIAPGGRILLVVVVRDDDQGPPFHLSESTLKELYESQDWVESVQPLEGDFAEKGFACQYYLIQAK